MKSRWFIALAAIIGLALFSSLSIPVAAATPTVNLVLGSSGAMPWTVANIAPGSSGTYAVTLSNTGSADGMVTIWLSDIVNSEGANPEPETGDTADPGELGDYLILNVSGTDLSANFALPANINNFPQGTADARYLYVNQLKAFSTLNLQWEWRLPPETGNDVQGDELSFTINYMLEEFPPPAFPQVGITNTGPSGTSTGFSRSWTLAVTNTGAVTLHDVVVTDYLPDNLSFKSAIPNADTITGSQISWNLGTLDTGETKEIVTILSGVSSGTAVNIATVTTLEGVTATDSLTITVLGAPGAHMSLIDSSDPVAVGDEFTYTIQVLNQSEANIIHNMTIVGLIPSEAVYLSAEGPAPFTIAGNEVRFGPVVAMTPGETIEFHIKVKATAAGSAVFNSTMRWDEFEEPIVSQEGTTIFMTVLPASANFKVHNLTIGSVQARPGEGTSISYEVVNTGGQSGEFTLEISIPSLLQTSQLIKLEAGQTQVVSLTLPPGNPGTYQVDIGGVKDTFTIGTLHPAPSGIQKVMSYWLIPFLLAVIGAVVMVCYIVIIIRRRRTLYLTKHQKRVAELASAIALEMHLSKKLVKKLLKAGISHNTGSVELHYPVAQTALQYHERLNGSGYPQKLAGDDILLEARILAVADTMETMSSPRPYGPSMGLDKVLEEIKRESNALYDSEVIKALTRLIEQGKFEFKTAYS